MKLPAAPGDAAVVAQAELPSALPFMPFPYSKWLPFVFAGHDVRMGQAATGPLPARARWACAQRAQTGGREAELQPLIAEQGHVENSLRVLRQALLYRGRTRVNCICSTNVDGLASAGLRHRALIVASAASISRRQQPPVVLTSGYGRPVFSKPVHWQSKPLMPGTCARPASGSVTGERVKPALAVPQRSRVTAM